MPRGQAHTTWFPELKVILRQKWNENLTISQQMELVQELHEKLNQIRIDGKIKPPMMWCPTCKKRHQGEFSKVSITGMYFALKRFEICTEEEFKKLRRDWNKYSREKGINIYGKPIETEDKTQEIH